MASKPRVIGVVTEPAPATWWARHRHHVTLIAGLFLGYQLCATTGTAAHTDQPEPRPTHAPTTHPSVKPFTPSETP